MSNSKAQLGVYVHWPYCARICPYCDFNVYRTRDIDAGRWRAALIRDLEYWRARTGPRRLASLYFGGGTPSLASIEVVEGVIDACERLWGFENGPEITLEANPTDAARSRFQAFARAGVNRLSLGVQSFDDAALAFLGRDHDGAAARRAVEAALSSFPRASFDLIYALPDQTEDAWRAALRAALRTGVRHLSLYQLTIEPGTAFERAVARGRWRPPDDGLAAALYDIAQEETAAAGLAAYEISNHAAPGEESRHNLLYWRYQDYVGVGPGAHGRLRADGRRIAVEIRPHPEDYLAAVEREGCGAASVEALDAEAVLIERLSMGLRLAEGVILDAEDLAALGPRAARLDALAREGLVARDGARLAATAEGRRLLDALLARILA
ncbi:radical SAM family heme chaperone HemW [Amphiplicatus metriothermophilus]|uniref:Heme chaperone HemW n=1 Tax=Amphiplicatus metriothermophilus TaxID=1519374 RepID=A0A239PJU7_9PROT|nr:radical SAM family heme chaperone HemW [Amphiplicatus metriothermophilus]MBB5517590.1 oxygen-independent coproporphyrinogen-3 oxidase [Amphiplicatus metriothermophilus]SNT68076.1 coproporphyrinogen III oxidase, anaerobic [Amphiplicatus metriothermophilus]